MSDTASGNGTEAAAPEGPKPEVRMLAQYIKDVSFESPRTTQMLPQSVYQPQVNISVSVNARAFDEQQSEFEVELALEGKGEKDGEVVFLAELVYAGRMQVRNVPDEMKAPLTLIEAPRILFPFARRILADLVRDGGFPQLLIEPIDFATLYRQRMEQAAAGQGQAESAG